MNNMVIKRTFDGYMTEIAMVCKGLEKTLNVKIEEAPDKWDRLFNVDFFIKINGKYIGLQIKPTGYDYIPQMIKEKKLQKSTHDKFTKEYGGKVFYIFSIKKDKKKVIANEEILDEIKQEIKRLS